MSNSCDLLNCTAPGFSVHGISQARILEWVAISFSRGSSQPRDWSHLSCIVGRFFTTEPDSFPLEGPTCVISSVQLLSHIQLCDPMDCSRSGFPVHHQLPKLPQTQVHRVSDSIQSSHLLSSPSPAAFYLSQHEIFSNESVIRIRWAKYCRFSFSIGPTNEYSELVLFRIHWFDLLAVKGTGMIPLKSKH